MSQPFSSTPLRTPVLHIDAVGKDYHGTTVLNDVTLALNAGEVLALTGENGAGKSTLSKIMCGLTPATRGGMRLAGQPFEPASRQEAERQGVRMVLQELSLVPTLTVAENLLLGRMPHRCGWLRRSELHAAARAQLAKIGLESIDPATPVSRLGIGQQQMVEIARNLQDDTRILVLDEPTSAPASRRGAWPSSMCRTGSKSCAASPTAPPCCATAGWWTPAPWRACRKTTWCAAWWAVRSTTWSTARAARPARC